MHWPQLPDLGSSGMDVDMSLLFLADDFKCMATGPINDVHIWGSFRDDVLPPDGPSSLAFEISIYSDIPAEVNSWSMPGELLWSRIFGPGEYSARKVNDGLEGWYDPAKELYLPDNHTQAYQYNFCIEEEPFIQDQGRVYWLGIKELAPDEANYKFGWKTTTHKLRWNDNAVFFLAGRLFSFPLEYPKEHEYMGESLDLAFVITGSSEEGQGEHDLGDAPDSSNSFGGASMLAYPSGVVGNFPTVYETGSPPYGPIHWQPKARVYLGSDVTGESEADLGYDEDLKNNLAPPADLSDQDGGDDGVQLPLVLPHCGEATFDYTLSFSPLFSDTAYVNVWCDWNRDGDWDDTVVCPDGVNVPEWAVQNESHLISLFGTYVFTSPAFMCWHPQTEGELDPMWMRITVSLQPWEAVAGAAVSGGSGPAGGYDYGETEDYFIYPKKEDEPLEYDWGDAPDGAAAPGYPTLSMNNGANHVIAGPWLGDENDQPDSESDGQPDTNALGDNNNGNDDENGVTIPTLIRGETADITLDVRGGGGVVQAWIDFNGDMTWQATEEIFNAFLPNGAHTISFSVPTSAMPGQTFARFRISKQGGLGPEGPALDGEVEDHEVFVEEIPKNIKWTQWPDLTPNGIDIRVDNSDGNNRYLADDFECISNDLITDVRLWGSWKNDRKGEITKIQLRIYSDDPTGAGGQEPDNQFSKPNAEALWLRVFSPGDYQETLYHIVRNPGEWWWDPVTGEYGPGGDSEVWQIDLHINPDRAFLQQGSPENPVIYWLVVNVFTENGEFGWKTRQWPDHYMDDAVWRGVISAPLEWRELRYPKTHPYHNLEKNSIDMAFQLKYTGEGPDQPTSRPVSATQCPIAQTQCPTVATRCPPVQTQCPAVQTQCPAVPTQCPVAKTKCPAVQTQCPAVDTECPPEPTKCTGTAETKCPPVETRCPVVETECPPLDTTCNIEKTKCPPVDTQCPAVDTKCPPEPTKCTGTAETKCPPVETRCPVVETECPPAETRCPPEPTKCPPALSKCPAVPTQCTAVETRCPPVETKCPTLDTECPPIETKCNLEKTKCPPVDTQCPAVDTECPSEPTVCPAVTTQCPLVQTQCPITATHMTQCPAVPTRCPPETTKCPLTDTQCPAVDTECPSEPTVCPAVTTQCPLVQTQCPITLTHMTQCPAVETRCPPEDTKCPPIDTECPPVDTECPPTVTECRTVETKCPVTLTQCRQVETECPATLTKCEQVYTRCPATVTECEQVYTKCPMTETTCVIIETECEDLPTRCPPVDTECPSTLSTCPPVPTQCTAVETRCPPDTTKCPTYDTRCPVSYTKCPAPLTDCQSEPTVCPPVKTECPTDPTTCPAYATKCVIVPTQCQVLTKCPADPTECVNVDTVCPYVRTQCPPEPTQCSATKCPVQTQCPIEESVCNICRITTLPIETKCPICIPATIVGCPIVTVFGCQREGTNSAPYVRQCPAIDVQAPTVITKPIAKAF